MISGRLTLIWKPRSRSVTRSVPETDLIGLLSALTIAPLLPLRLSAGQLKDLVPSTLRDRPYVVVPYDDAIDSTKIEEIRNLGVRVRVAFSPLIAAPDEEGKKLPLTWFEQPMSLTFAPERAYRYLALDEPEAFAYAESRARDLARSASSFDGLLLVVQTRSDALFRYSAASRRLAVERTGLDPIDFEDPAEETGPSTSTAYRLPDEVASVLLDSSVAKTRKLAKIVADAFAREGRSVAIEGSSRALPPTLRGRLLLYAPWQDVFPEVGPNEIWIRPSVAYPEAVEDTVRELKRLKSTAVIIGEYQRKNLPTAPPPQIGGLIERT